MSFARDIKNFVTGAKKKADVEYQKNVILLYNDIVVGTPVRDGTLQNNWQFGVHRELNGDQLPSAGGNPAAPILREAPKIENSLTIDKNCILFNNMEYAEVIENGLEGTRRVPARMVARAIAQAAARNKV